MARKIYQENNETSTQYHDMGLYQCPRSRSNLSSRTKHKNKLLPSMASLRSKYMFQDKATPHTSKMTTLYLKESRIQTVTLPGSSPDINPIENCFSFVKSKLEKEDTSNLPKLRSCIRSKWNKLDRKYLEKLCLSMPRRLRDVLKRKGGMTKY